MSVRGPRGGHGRGRGRGRGSTMIWEWETYRPTPDVYDNIWHIRQAPATVAPQPPNDCPIPDARSRILERRQSEDGFGRNFYFVEITYLGGQEPTSTWVQSSDNSERGGTEVERVDVSRILQYVSPRELERFENEQFKIEAEAQAVADREEEAEQIQKRMKKNARAAMSGRGRGNHTVDGLGIDPDLQSTATIKGRPRGRGRSRRRGRGSSVLSGLQRELPQDAIVDSQPSQTSDQRAKMPFPEIAETDVESNELDSDIGLKTTSPSLMRSALVANSALSLSPVLPNKPAPSAALQQGRPEVPNRGSSNITSEDGTDGFMPSAATQLQFEGGSSDIAIALSESVSSDDEDAHRSKRRKTESVASHQELMFPPSSPHQPSDSASEDDSIPLDPPSTVKAPRNMDVDDIQATSTAALPLTHPEEIVNTPSSSGDEDAEEYVVESIIEHYYDEGRKYYLVKWEGYEDSYEWLSEKDLEGAAEVVNEYNEKFRRRKGKSKVE
ncbi:uncharacterized protein EKO05_0008016 [Ascochyta rabiei]|uniref:Nucleus n=1 Tax=Didymella rabiei TaxID=5454 RepID=A0A163B5Y7_DIDRA|nr:uncharacterized protein EKO05_0008016 [Ascochyta rabiei]KZM21591.1 nucleus [Ascochyta rabiei]UPX17675.1 hypothetical protein EKO05_0008016 [Ascochyta rabiei]